MCRVAATRGYCCVEVTPGNQLSNANLRKSQCLYWSIAEFGSQVLMDEEAWFTGVVVTSTDVKKVDGAMSAVLGAFLKLFLGEASVEARWSGVLLPLPDAPLNRIWIALGAVLADTEALRQVARACI